MTSITGTVRSITSVSARIRRAISARCMPRGVAVRGAAIAAIACVAAGSTVACATGQPSDEGDTSRGSAIVVLERRPNTLSDAEQRQGWRLLFDGTNLDGWREYRSDAIPAGWGVAGGTMTKSAVTRDIISRDQFGDFELAFEWKIETGGNAGVFYRATEEYEHVYWSGPEYQLLDDVNAGAEGQDRLRAAGAAYGLYGATAGIVKPAGEWNSSRIIANGAHVEHWLNGTKLLEYELWSPDWEAKIKASKFNPDWPNYGRARRGHIALQGDHRGDLELRNIMIREIR